MISIKPIKALSDNYIWLVTTNEGSIVIDPGESKQIIDLIKSNKIDLEGILITHTIIMIIRMALKRFSNTKKLKFMVQKIM